ncbi:MAG: hypothetical protein R3F19_06310 [Verrucomicrobiales bacterium]
MSTQTGFLKPSFNQAERQCCGVQEICLNRGLGADGNIRFSAPLLASNSSDLDLSAPAGAL